ncbi:MAG: ThuA domain-containing protein [Phycisphaerae bacterium]|nr:ThuA domain-containing protein [Phycisphaerae bacterium]
MRALCCCLWLTVGLLLPAQAAEQPAKEKLIRVLLITGRDVPVHPWRETTPVLREHLEKTKKFEVVVSEEPLVLESSDALAGYDVILLNYYNWQRPSITEKAKENLLSFVKGGKGLVSFHFSVRAFGEWPEYRNLIGRIWTTGSGHGPRGKFQSKVVKPDHPITAGVPETFEADDELYAKLVGDAPIDVLVEAYSEWSKKTEPLAWTLTYGKGRVFNIVYGHDARACQNPSFAKLLQQGTLWVARK